MSMEEETQPFVGRKKVVRVGGSLYVLLPKSFLESNELKEGSEVGLVANKDLLITTDDEVVKELVDEMHAHAHKKIREFLHKESAKEGQ